MCSQAATKHAAEPKEFGGRVGALALMLWSHWIMYYYWYCLEFHKGTLALPWTLDQTQHLLLDMFDKITTHAAPTTETWMFYAAFFVLELVFASVMPGIIVDGLPLEHEGRKKLPYLCNAFSSWIASIMLGLGLHFFGLFPITYVADNYPRIMTACIISGDVLSLVMYVGAHLTGNTFRMTGDHIYDFFMGASLNPRLGNVDLKMFAEGRLSWILFYYINLSCVFKQYEQLGYVTTPMIFLSIAQWLYANAVMKGEECIITTWDIFHEKWGWMLIYWNLAGVPFMYTLQPVYLLKHGPRSHPTWYMVTLFAFLFASYYIWDTANSQKNFFRAHMNGSFQKRFTFPQLPWRELKNPKYLKTEAGSLLLVGGWWAYARKIHYTTDVCMALSWGLVCGFGSFIPFFYCVFFGCALTHRTIRDIEKMSKKYGKDWDKYCQVVPYTFIPGII